MNEKKVVKRFKIALILLSGISVLIILILVNAIDSQNKQMSYLQENYEYACMDGTKRVCINEDKNYLEYAESEYAVRIKDDETYVICDTDRKEKAICIDEDLPWTQCNDLNEWAFCRDISEDWTSCSVGKDAICVEDNTRGTIDTYGRFTACEAGEWPVCQ